MNQARGMGIEDVMRRALATGLFVSLASFSAPDGLLTDGGQPSGTFAPVPNHQAIPCMSMPMGEARILASEMQGLKDVMASAPRHVLLNAYYPEIEGGVSNGWIVEIDDIDFDVLGAESDSQGQMTRIAVRLRGI
jgi:hypothetical protein